MNGFWTVLQSTLAAGLVGALILVLKLLFHDKLDARWHYFIWLVLLVRLVVPVSVTFIRTPVSLFQAVPLLQWVKELELVAGKRGGKLTEVLWPLYLVGCGVLFLYDLLSYAVLRFRVKRFPHAGEALQRRVEQIAKKYELGKVPEIRLGSAAAPYVCGIFHQVLVLSGEPGETAALEPIVVHELLHCRYKDVCVNLLLHLVRILNWFNPFIWYLTAVIQNDSEALCDQRVLERMKGESAAGYGRLLLSMAEKKGTCRTRVGTTDMANSYTHMKIRIRRLADAAKIPAGIGIAVLCITVILSVSCIGYAAGNETLDTGGVRSERSLKSVLLDAQVYSAGTAQQAVFLYLRAMKTNDPALLMAVTPRESWEELESWTLDCYRKGTLDTSDGLHALDRENVPRLTMARENS